MSLTPKLLAYLHRVFNKDPKQFLALRITCDSGAMTWTVADTILTLTPVGGTATPLTVDLSQFTVQSLASYLATLPGYIVVYQDGTTLQALSALVLIEGSGDVTVSNGDHFYGYQSLLWAFMNAYASELELAQAQIINALAQMSTTTAEDVWLDYLGTYYDVPRNPGELDPAYSQRIIASVLLPSSNNIGMAIALMSRFPGTVATVVDALVNSGSLLIRDGSIHFNSLFEHNSNTLGIANGFFDVTLAFNFNGPISPTQYVTMLISAVNGYRAGGTYIRNIIIKNGVSASVITSTYSVGSILVIVYDQYETIEDAWDWTEEPEDNSYMAMMEDSAAGMTNATPLQYQDDYPWDTQTVEQDDERIDEFSTNALMLSADPQHQPDAFDWTASEPDEDDSMMAIDSQPVGADGAPNPFPDDFDWTQEEPDQDERMEMLDTQVVTDDGAPVPFLEDLNELWHEEENELPLDEYINSDAPTSPVEDAWPWNDADPEDEFTVDDYLSMSQPATGALETEGGSRLDTESGSAIDTET